MRGQTYQKAGQVPHPSAETMSVMSRPSETRLTLTHVSEVKNEQAMVVALVRSDSDTGSASRRSDIGMVNAHVDRATIELNQAVARSGRLVDVVNEALRFRQHKIQQNRRQRKDLEDLEASLTLVGSAESK